MSTAAELRDNWSAKYKTILGRNIYNQNLRNYCYHKYNGHYYSDCSSSHCLTWDEIGVSTGALNTEDMYYSSLYEKVPVSIIMGHIANADFSKLRKADALMFAGNDASRPLKIGHIETIYRLGSNEADTTIAGHGSNTPSTKNMYDYLEQRYNSLAAGGWHKGVVCVLRRISDDGSEVSTFSPEYDVATGSAGLEVITDNDPLIIRDKAATGKQVGNYPKGSKIYPTKKIFVNGDAWFGTDLGWVSGKYVSGWIQEISDEKHRWWYVERGYSCKKSSWIQYKDSWYYFDKDGWMAVYTYVKSQDKDLYYWINKDGIWDPHFNTVVPDLDNYTLTV